MALSRNEIIKILDTTVRDAFARMSERKVDPLPLRGNIERDMIANVSEGLNNGQLAIVSTSFLREVLNHLLQTDKKLVLPDTPMVKYNSIVLANLVPSELVIKES